MESGDGTLITIVPDKTFRVSVTNVGPEGRFTQYFSAEVTPETYEREIAPPAPSSTTRTSSRCSTRA
jgi:UDP-3-O-[3-hydroxymyristoyl] N-acetylglucosamine deacetylase/3-hydroxyacyl-[acyl-carrier-protein] dehydratase